MEEFITDTKQKLIVHNKSNCKGYCPIHNPSNHHMKNWPLHWREDFGMFERICKCGVGHPDPDSLDFIKQKDEKFANALSIHGCCGCCLKDKGEQNE